MTMIGAFLLRNPPAGYRPEGWSPDPSTAEAGATSRDFSPGEMLRMPTFYLMWIAFALGTSAGLMVISQLKPFAEERGISSGRRAPRSWSGRRGASRGGRSRAGCPTRSAA